MPWATRAVVSGVGLAVVVNAGRSDGVGMVVGPCGEGVYDPLEVLADIGECVLDGRWR